MGASVRIIYTDKHELKYAICCGMANSNFNFCKHWDRMQEALLLAVRPERAPVRNPRRLKLEITVLLLAITNHVALTVCLAEAKSAVKGPSIVSFHVLDGTVALQE